MVTRKKAMTNLTADQQIKKYEEMIKILKEVQSNKKYLGVSKARPTGLTRQSEKYGKRPKAKPITDPVKASSPGTKTMTYSPGKRKAINDFTTGRPNISTSKINTMLSSKINKPGGMGMGTKSKSNTPGGMGVPNKRVLQKALTSANINRGKIGEREKSMLERRKKLKDKGYYTVTDKAGNRRAKRK